MRALLLILDSVGCGEAPDAAAFGDEGANTLGHILARSCRTSSCRISSRSGSGKSSPAMCSRPARAQAWARWGRMRERSRGKDTVTGHWEIAGRDPAGGVCDLRADAGGAGGRAGEGVRDRVSRQLRPQRHGHPRGARRGASRRRASRSSTPRPIPCCRSPRTRRSCRSPRLYDICRRARRLADRWRIGRVIARPFIGRARRLSAHRRPARLRHGAAAHDPERDRRARPAGARHREDLATFSRAAASPAPPPPPPMPRGCSRSTKRGRRGTTA